MDKSKELEILSSLNSENYSIYLGLQKLHTHKVPISEISAWEEEDNEISPIKLESSSMLKKLFHSTPSPRKSIQRTSKTIPTSPINTSKKELNSIGNSSKLPEIKGYRKQFYRYTTEDPESPKPNNSRKKLSWLTEIKVIKINEFRPICNKNIKNMLKITQCMKGNQIRSLSQTKKVIPN